jgi:hypothetical protein
MQLRSAPALTYTPVLVNHKLNQPGFVLTDLGPDRVSCANQQAHAQQANGPSDFVERARQTEGGIHADYFGE